MAEKLTNAQRACLEYARDGYATSTHWFARQHIAGTDRTSVARRVLRKLVDAGLMNGERFSRSGKVVAYRITPAGRTLLENPDA